jgi:hypothetical protein
MLLLADPAAFRMNLVLILGAIFLLGLVCVGALVVVTLIRTALWVKKRRQAEQTWARASRRADGRPYPGRMSGTCELCHRGGTFIYSDYGKNLCPACYEKEWRRVENWTGPEEKPELMLPDRPS